MTTVSIYPSTFNYCTSLFIIELLDKLLFLFSCPLGAVLFMFAATEITKLELPDCYMLTEANIISHDGLLDKHCSYGAMSL